MDAVCLVWYGFQNSQFGTTKSITGLPCTKMFVAGWCCGKMGVAERAASRRPVLRL
jgi:hypothetical protein